MDNLNYIQSKDNNNSQERSSPKIPQAVRMQKQKRSQKKYQMDPPFSDSLSNQAHLSQIKQQLRHTIQQLEQYKLSSELQNQKRLIAEQQLLMIREENAQLRNDLEACRKELGKLAKKYAKWKEQKICDKCKNQQQIRQKAQRERQIFLKQRNILKCQIQQLKSTIQSITSNQKQQFRSSHTMQNLHKQLQYKTKTVQDQKKIIKYLDEKLSNFEVEKMQTLSYVEQVDQKLQELQMENLILKGRENSPVRKNGSIKYLERSRSRASKMSPSRY